MLMCHDAATILIVSDHGLLKLAHAWAGSPAAPGVWAIHWSLRMQICPEDLLPDGGRP